MRTFVLLVSLAGFGASGPAWAGWEYTAWNMTPKQVRKASKAKFSEPDEFDQRVRRQGNMTPLLATVHRSGPYIYDVDFLFDPDERLQRVVLKLRDVEKCPDVIRALRSRYGQTSIDRSEGPLTSLEWQDGRNENVISMQFIPALQTCTLMYSYTLTYNRE